jgi:hypothetical protein
MTPPRTLTIEAIAQSAAWFPHMLDPGSGRVLLVEKSEAEYRDASFLDERSLRQDAARHVVEWHALEAAMAPPARGDAHYIFHLGHVGSTLISRLLGELPGLFGLREPLLLRTFAEMLEQRGTAETVWDPASIPARIATLDALLSRTFRADQRALVKATSFTSEIAPDIVPAGSRALLLYTRADRYMAGILAGENSRQEIKAGAPARLRRLHRRIGAARWKLWTLQESEAVAMSWACEMTSLAQAAASLPAGSVLWLDFEDFLRSPAAVLQDLARFFGQPLDAAGAAALARHPFMGRYSKALEYEYSPALREEVLAQARREHGGALARAAAWLDGAAREEPAIAAAVETSLGNPPPR